MSYELTPHTKRNLDLIDCTMYVSRCVQLFLFVGIRRPPSIKGAHRCRSGYEPAVSE
jgi:hypothetical protein